MKTSFTSRTLILMLCLILLAAFAVLPVSASAAPASPGTLSDTESVADVADSVILAGGIEDVNALLSAYDTTVLLVVAAVALFIGLFGAKLYRFSIFMGGFGAGWILSSTLYNFIAPILPADLPTYAPILFQLVVGILFGVLAGKLIRTGIVLASAAATFFFLNGFELFNMLVDLIYAGEFDAKYLIARILVSLIIGLLALKLTDLIMMIVTAAAGGMIAGVAAMVMLGQAQNILLETIVCILLIVLCLVVQFRTKGRRH